MSLTYKEVMEQATASPTPLLPWVKTVKGDEIHLTCWKLPVKLVKVAGVITARRVEDESEIWTAPTLAIGARAVEILCEADSKYFTITLKYQVSIYESLLRGVILGRGTKRGEPRIGMFQDSEISGYSWQLEYPGEDGKPQYLLLCRKDNLDLSDCPDIQFFLRKMMT